MVRQRVDAGRQRPGRRPSTSRSPRRRRCTSRRRTSSTATAGCSTTSSATRGPTRVDGTLDDRRRASSAIDGWYGARDHSLGHPLDDGPARPDRRRRAGVGRRGPPGVRIWVPFENEPRTRLLPHARGRRGQDARLRGSVHHDGDDVAAHRRRPPLRVPRRARGGSPAASSRCSTRIGGDSADYHVRAWCARRPTRRASATPAAGPTAATPGVYRGVEYVESRPLRRRPTRTRPSADRTTSRRTAASAAPSSPPRSRAPTAPTGMAHVEHMIYGTYEPAGFVGPNPWQLER